MIYTNICPIYDVMAGNLSCTAALSLVHRWSTAPFSGNPKLGLTLPTGVNV